jgi:virginiamycin B lyase
LGRFDARPRRGRHEPPLEAAMKKLPFVVLSIASLGSVALALGQPTRRTEVNLPEGDGKSVVEARCGTCHRADLVTGAGYNRDGWESLFTSMVELPPDETAVVANYLAKHFPETPKPLAVVIPGSASISIHEWVLPTLGSRPHDPLATSDGAIWWTGQWANVLGRLDPKTGEMKEYPLPTPKSGPHGLTVDADGNIWYSGNAAGLVGKLNPRTGEVTEYPMPDPAARDPHTPIFDRAGNLVFTVQNGNMVGRLDPKTGDIRLVTSPTPKSRPYGIVMNSRGVMYFVEFGSNKVARIDSSTMEIREYVLPHAESRPRRLTLTSDGVIWYSDYSRGYLGRLDPETRAVEEWPSPGGPKSQPYGIAAIGDIVWYSESNVSPNTMVRFDPKTEKFQTWTIPSGGGVVRNMMATPEGNLVLAESAVNRVALVEIHEHAPSQ